MNQRMNETETNNTETAPPAAPAHHTFGMHGPLTKPQLAKLSVVELVALHNAAVPANGKPVKVFHTKGKAVDKVWSMYPASSEAELAALVAASSNGAAGESDGTNNEESDMAKKGSKAKAAKTPKAKKTGGTRSKLADETKIKVVAKENPYRAGTKAHATFNLFEKCDTVADFRKKVDPEKHDGGYIKYASRDGYIKLG